MLPSFPISSRIAKTSLDMAELEATGDETIELMADSKLPYCSVDLSQLRKQSEDCSDKQFSSGNEDIDFHVGGITALRKYSLSMEQLRTKR